MNNRNSPSENTQIITTNTPLSEQEQRIIMETSRQLEKAYAQEKQNVQEKSNSLNAEIVKFLQKEKENLEKNQSEARVKIQNLEKNTENKENQWQENLTEMASNSKNIHSEIWVTKNTENLNSKKIATNVHFSEKTEKITKKTENLTQTVEKIPELETIRKFASEITQDGIVGGDEDFQKIREMAKIIKNLEKNSDFFASNTVKSLRAMIGEIWKNKAFFTERHFRELRNFEKSLYENEKEMPVMERVNQIVPSLFASEAKDRRDDIRRAMEQEMTLNKVKPMIFSVEKPEEPRVKIQNLEKNETIANENSEEPRVKIQNLEKNTENKENQWQENLTEISSNSENSDVSTMDFPKEYNDKTAENRFLKQYFPAVMATETRKIVFLQTGLTILYKDEKLDINGVAEEKTINATKRFQEDFSKKYPNVKIVKNGLPDDNTLDKLSFVLMQRPKMQEKREDFIKYFIVQKADAIDAENAKQNEKEKENANNADVQNTDSQIVKTAEKSEKQKFRPSDAELEKLAKNPMEIKNEMVRTFYIQRGLNMIKSTLTESGAKMMAARASDVELTGVMNAETKNGITAFQKYVNYYKYYTNEPLKVTGNMDNATMAVMVSRINFSGGWNGHSKTILEQAIQDYNNTL